MELATRVTAVEGTLTAQGTQIQAHTKQINDNTQTLETLTKAVEGIVDLLETGNRTTLTVQGTALTGRIVEPGTQPVTRLKMRLQHTCDTKNEDNPLVHVSFQALGDDPAFGKYTPNGNLNFSVIPEVAANLVVGKAYFVDLSLAE